MRMYMERTAWNTFIIPIKGHLIFIVTFIFSIGISYLIVILFDSLKELVKKDKAAHEDGIKICLNQVSNCSNEHAATCEASDIRTEVKMTKNPNEADSIVPNTEVNTNEVDTSTKTMGNCASEDATSKGSGIRGKERMAWNPNEADVVIDTKKDVKPTEATSSSPLNSSNASTSHENVKAVHATISSPANLNEAAAHETIPFPKNGIKLSYLLNEFVKECGGRRALKNKTTTQVCDKIVKRKTKKYGLSYCDMILEKSKTKRRLDGVVKTATVFISHAWQYKFLDVLDALEEHFKDEPDRIVWFDLVSNNQHKAGVLPYEWWATTFKDAIEQLGHTVMVMAPWNDPIPYKRAWCIFEAYCTSVTDAKFEIAMSNNEHRAFIEECKLGSTETINKMLSIVNAEKSEAWNPMDKERIHTVIRNEVGFAKINSMVFEQLRDWVLVVARVELEQVKEDTKDEADLIYLVANLYGGQGRYDEAEPLYKECLAKQKMIVGSDHLDTLTSMNNLAYLYQSQGKYDDAESLYKDCLAKKKTILGSDHPDTLTSMNNLAAFYESQGKYDEAEPLYKECLAKQKTILGSDHPDNLTSMNNLAGLYRSQGKYDKAEPLFMDCLAKRVTILGSDHPHTLTSMNNLAGLYRSQGKYDEAEPLYKECLAKHETILGSDHPNTLASLNNLAGFFNSQGKYGEAEPLYKACLEKYKARLGSDYPDTLMSMNDLAVFYRKQGKFDEAEPLFKESLAKQKTILGSDHPNTLRAMYGLVKLYVDQGKFDEAEPLYQLHLKNCETLLGPDDGLSIAIRENLDNVEEIQSEV